MGGVEGRYLGGTGGGKLCNSISIKIIKKQTKKDELGHN